MHPCCVWRGLDRLAFCENAILLELKARSQGSSTKVSARQDDSDLHSEDDLSRQMICNFLDDFALVMSGAGGKNNVSAVCMEADDQDQIITLRVARNEGVDDQALLELNRIARLMTTSIPNGLLT
jgi:hypothetical protein